MKIIIKEVFKDDWISRVAGEKLRLMIVDSTSKGEIVELDFAGATIASTSFFDEGFAKLDNATRQKLVLKNLNKNDKKTMEMVCRNRC